MLSWLRRPDPVSEPVSLDAWRVACRSAALKPGRVTRRDYPDGPVLLGRTRDGVAYALRDLCPHRGAALSEGKIRRETDGSETVECPYHAWRFGPDGACRAIPTAGDGLDVSKVRVRRYPLAERDGLLWIWVSSDPRFEGEPPDGPPENRNR